VEDNSSSVTVPNPPESPQFRTTCGEILGDGTVIDLVNEGDRLFLVHWDGREAVIVPYLNHGDVVYTPPRLALSLYQAVRFPGAPIDFGSLRTLFHDTSAVFERCGCAKDDARWWSVVVLATWVPEIFPSPPTVIVCGSDMEQAAILFGLFARLCRRALTVAELSRNLPFSIRPTLLVLSAELSAKQRAFWRASNFQGVQIPCRGGALDTFACPRLLFTDAEDSLAVWGPNDFRFRLLPYSRLFPLAEKELNKIAVEFQAKFLMFRLRRLHRTNVTTSHKAQANKFSNSPLARKLLACVQDEPEIVATISPFLEAQEREILEQQGRDPYRAIIESIWSPSHTSKEIPISDLTKRVNAILLSRGEVIELDSRVVGWKLTHLRLPRDRDGKGKLLRFSRDVRRRLHEFAHAYQLDLPKLRDCDDCKRR